MWPQSERAPKGNKSQKKYAIAIDSSKVFEATIIHNINGSFNYEMEINWQRVNEFGLS